MKNKRKKQVFLNGSYLGRKQKSFVRVQIWDGPMKKGPCGAPYGEPYFLYSTLKTSLSPLSCNSSSQTSPLSCSVWFISLNLGEETGGVDDVIAGRRNCHCRRRGCGRWAFVWRSSWHATGEHNRRWECRRQTLGEEISQSKAVAGKSSQRLSNAKGGMQSE